MTTRAQTTEERETEAAIREILEEANQTETARSVKAANAPGSCARQVENAIRRNARVLKPSGIRGVRH